MQREANVVRVGLTVAVALALLLGTVLIVGERNFLFTRTNEYFVQLETVAGLVEGNPVQLNGVNVGKVERIILPEEASKAQLEVWLSLERRYANRVRADSQARIKTLGLLGDKYVEITSGSPQAPEISPGQQIPAAQPTDVDELIASGEGVVDDIVVTAAALAKILGRMEAGEGVLGELITSREDGRKVTDEILATLQNIEGITAKIGEGEGLVGRLLTDRQLADQVTSAATRLDDILAEVQEGAGLVPALIHDTTVKQRFDDMLSSLSETLAVLSRLSGELEGGDGLLPRLLLDGELGESISGDLEEILERLNVATQELTEGDGTAARLLNDPEIYEALNDILVGIDESKFLRWLIRNRQKSGIKKRYNEAQEDLEASGEPGP